MRSAGLDVDFCKLMLKTGAKHIMEKLTVDPDLFRRHLDMLFTYMQRGDRREQEFGRLLQPSFPNCERFWRMFFIPSTQRVSRYPEYYPLATGFRPDMDPKVLDIAEIHYSLFCHLVYAHVHLSRVGTVQESLSWLEDFYVHLVSACDLAEALLEKSYLLLLRCRGKKSKTLELLTKEQFLALTGEWYDKYYEKVFDYYLSKGRGRPIRIPEREHLLREFVEDDLQEKALWEKYFRLSVSLRQYRNYIVHDILIRKLIVEPGVFIIPRREALKDNRHWRDDDSATDEEKVNRGDFVKPDEQAYADLKALEEALNQLWEVLMKELEAEFYTEERETLRDLYAIAFERSREPSKA
jgi:hypothetical protein